MLRLRKAALGDASALAELAERTFRLTFASSNTPEDMDTHCASAYGTAIQAAEIADPRMETWLCEASGALVGYAQLRWKTAPACVDAKQPIEIQRIYFEPEWQGQGAARTLMAHLLERAILVRDVTRAP